MLTYWILFLIPAAAVHSPRQVDPCLSLLMWWLIGAVFTLVIGLRFQAGVDWFAYLCDVDRAAAISLDEVLTHGNPGYYLLN